MIGAIILGILAGFIGKALMPGKDPGGFFVTILIGLGGALIGYFIFTELLGIGDNEMFYRQIAGGADRRRVDPAA